VTIMATNIAGPQVVALDAQALREGAWPHPNPRLLQLSELAHRFGAQVWLMAGALEEVRFNMERNATEAVDSLTKAIALAHRTGLKAESNWTTVEEMLTDWDRRAATAVARLNATVVSHTSRTVDEFFRMAVRRVPPFAESGNGFRDAVIYLSLVDGMSRGGLSSALFVSRDKDFRHCKPPDEQHRIDVMSLDAAIEQFEGFLKQREAAVFQEAMDQVAVRAALARDAVRSAAEEIETFLADNLIVGRRDLPGLPGLLKKPLSYRLQDVRTPTLSPLFEDVPPGAVLQASVFFNLIGDFEIFPFALADEQRLRLDEDLEDKLRRHALLTALASDAEPQRVETITFPFQIAADIRLSRTLEGYSFVGISELRHLSAPIRGLLAAASESEAADGL
jgi:hypothetical protein